MSFLIFSIVYVSYGMCRPQYRQPPKGNCCARAGKCLFSPRVWYIIAALAMLGGTGAALSLVTSFKNAVRAGRGAGRWSVGCVYEALTGGIEKASRSLNPSPPPLVHRHPRAQTNDTTHAMTTFSDVIHLANTETNDYV